MQGKSTQKVARERKKKRKIKRKKLSQHICVECPYLLKKNARKTVERRARNAIVLPYLYRTFSAKEPYNWELFCGKRPMT